MSIIFMRALLRVSRALLGQSDVRDMDSTYVLCGVVNSYRAEFRENIHQLGEKDNAIRHLRISQNSTH